MELRQLLWPLALLYSAAQRFDRRAKLARAYRSVLPVISVGNLSVGGSGKTPLTMHLAGRLQEQGRVVILSRGYGRSSGEPILWRAGEPIPDLSLFGDEPALMARGVRSGAIGVAADRAALLRVAEPEFSGAVVLLDDGFQHYALERDLDIVIVDDRTAEHPWPLPVGDLREPPEALRRAGAILASSDAAEQLTVRWKSEGAELFRFANVPGEVMRWAGGTPYAGQEALLVSGIARPERLGAALAAHGIEPRERMIFRDHHRYTPRDADAILAAMRRVGAEVIVTTAKDAVKLEAFETVRENLFVLNQRTVIERESRLLALIGSAIDRRGVRP